MTLEPPRDPGHVSSFLNIRAADIHAACEQWRARGAEFLTPPTDRRHELRCYMRDPGGSTASWFDFPGAILAAGATAGLIPAERCVALLAGLRGQRLIPRPSFFQLDNIRKARARGEPWHLIVHEDVLVFRAPGKSPPARTWRRKSPAMPSKLPWMPRGSR